MSQQPSGRPLPAYVYRRRRLAVFGALAVVIFGLIMAIAQPWGKNEAAPVETVPVATATVPASTGSAGDAPDCTSSQVQIVPSTDQESYAAGVLPQLTVAVKNTGSEPCTLNVGTSQQVFTITSGSELLWVSTDCQTEKSDSDLVLQPKQTVTSPPIAWDRSRSNPGTCTLPERDPAPAGGASYELSVSIGGLTSAESAQFTLN